MSFTRRQILSAAAAATFTMSAPAVFAADRRVRIAVGGKAPVLLPPDFDCRASRVLQG